MPKRDNISMSVIRRLPRYYRFLSDLIDNGVMRISSRELSDKMGLTASQIRQDLNCFGGFGQQGYGYMVEQLHKEIGNILGLSHSYRSILIGAGNLGRAVATHMSFEARGFTLSGIFDKNPDLIGTDIRGILVQNIENLEDFCTKTKPNMAVLCVPRDSVAALADRMYALGIKNYWNFSHYDLAIKFPDVIVENVHMSDSLMTLCYRISDHGNIEEI
ncbi:MAG: redox-sensing transcriptional repressor Rex [Clostridiales bacterium]|jgi:redox-sensing transcriptional repressor|nr:redox-sensing transcriptional repressor Rex [Clostridiales bacterium]